jgi:DNA-binding MurR/RpiR family transcriptional regulator
MTSVEDRLLSAFDDLPPQLQTAARWLLDHRDDVAFLSMREVARRAAVAPATMTRLAQRLGYEGFGGLRELFANAVRARAVPFRERAEGLTARRDLDGDSALLADTLAVTSAHLRALAEPETQAAIVQAADILQQCERAYWVGARSGFAPMHLGAYLLSLIGEKTRLLDLAGGIGLDALVDLTPADALVALTIAPYTKTTVEAVAFAGERGTRIIALTDSRTSPIARNASVTIIVPTETPSFLHTMTPAFLVVECLAALVAARRGQRTIDAIARAEELLDRLGVYTNSQSARRRRS